MNVQLTDLHSVFLLKQKIRVVFKSTWRNSIDEGDFAVKHSHVFLVVTCTHITEHNNGSVFATSEPLCTHLRQRQCHRRCHTPAAERAALGGSRGGVRHQRRRVGANE